MTKICLGCGVPLQTEDKSAKGYIPSKKYQDSFYCERCFRLTHYGEEKIIDKPYTEDEIIERINNNPHLTLFLTDLLNITEEVFKLYHKIKTPKILIVNKCEILPKFLKKEKLIEYLRKTFNITDKIIIKGEKGSRNALSVLHFLEKNETSKTYLVGLSNSGKSTLINDLAQLLSSKATKVTTSKRFNTTLDFFEINLTTNLTLIDTPGFYLEPIIDIKKGKKIRSFVFQMQENETLNISGEYYITTVEKCNINFFTDMANERVIKKNYKKDKNYNYEVTVKKDEDLIIKGLGFINFKQTTLVKTNLDGSYLSIRKSIFKGGKNEQNSSNE